MKTNNNSDISKDGGVVVVEVTAATNAGARGGRRGQSTAGVLVSARRSRAISEAAVDEAWVRFAARFRFVDAAVLAARFEVSERRAQSRVARLVAAGVLGRRAVGGGPALL